MSRFHTTKSTEAILALGVDSRQQVDELVDQALAAGGQPGNFSSDWTWRQCRRRPKRPKTESMNDVSTEHRFYGDLAVWWPLISPPEEYAQEAAFAAMVFSSASIPVREVSWS
jgi:hypothetical protein